MLTDMKLLTFSHGRCEFQRSKMEK